MPRSVLFLGASRGCGHYAAVRLLSSETDDFRATFLLRKPDTLLASPDFSALPETVRERNVKIVQGDATKPADMEKAVQTAKEVGGGTLDTVVFSVGAWPPSPFPLPLSAH